MGKKKTRDALTYETLPELFTGICDAIREKTGSSATINHQDIPAQIAAIETGGDVEIAFNEKTAVPTYTAVTRTYTVQNAGKLRLIAELGSEARFLTFKKNNDSVTPTIAFEKSTQSNCCKVIENLTVAANDVITVEVASQAFATDVYIMGIITPTT